MLILNEMYLLNIYKSWFWSQQGKRERRWFGTAAAAAQVSRDACRDCMLAMIDSLDWWTCRTRYYMCYRERCWLTIDQKREYACGAEYLLRLQYTSLSNFMTGDFDTWWMNACRPFRMSHFRSSLASRRRTCVVNMSVYWCEICRSREHNSAGNFCCLRKLPIEQISSR